MLMPPNPFVREAAPGPRDTSRDAIEAGAGGIDPTQETMRSTSDKLKDAALDASDVLSIVSGLFGRAGL